MRKLLVCVAVCAALSLSAGSLLAGGEGEATGTASVKTTPTEKGRPSKIRVFLPTADAKLYFDDNLIKGEGDKRSFRSPALEEGKRYTYKVVAVWAENGRQVTHETSVIFHAGQDVSIDFRR